MAKEPFPSDQQDKFMLRLPEGMRDELREEARKNRRSMNAEIVSRLQTTLDRGVFTLQIDLSSGRTEELKKVWGNLEVMVELVRTRIHVLENPKIDL